MRGSSHTNNVRLYDVMMHGCIPVVISDDFQPPLDHVLAWDHFAIFLRTTQIPDLEGILRAVPEEERLARLSLLIGGVQALGCKYYILHRKNITCYNTSQPQ